MTDKKFIIFSAPSGSGKTTLVHRVLEKMNELSFSVSATTRPKRGHEKNGIDYYFISNEDFASKISKDEFVEWQEVYPGRFYGTYKSEIERIGKLGKTAVLDLDVMGGINVKQLYKNSALAIFIQAPSLEVLRKRLIERGTDSYDDIKVRLAKAENELTYKTWFDEVIINDNLDTAIEQTMKLIQDFVQK